MKILDIDNFNIKRKESLFILTSKDDSDPMTIVFTPAGWHITTPVYEALFCSNNEVCYSIRGVSLTKYNSTIPETLQFKLKKEDNSTQNMSDLVKLMSEVKIMAVKTIDKSK
jgi:hypothetical protein